MNNETNELQKKSLQNDELSFSERYKLIITARNFHYENFNKWMTYFYVAIGALFIGYCTIMSSKDLDPNKKTMLEYLILILGYTVSILWYWSCKGYYFWNINFITLVNYYEETILKFPKEARVYFVFANKKTENNYFSPIKGANISTSKIAILFAFIITSVWGSLLLYNIFQVCNSCWNCQGFIIITAVFVSIVSTLIISSILPKNLLASKIDHFHDLKIVHEKRE